MVGCNLAVLLAERKLNISRVAVETGISRTTLTALARNHSQGIQYDTLNTLCAYLETTPDKLILYHPVDFWIEGVFRIDDADPFSESMDAEIQIRIIKNKRSVPCLLFAQTTCFYDEACPCFKISLELAKPNNFDVLEENNNIFLRELSMLPVSFKQELESKIFDRIASIWPEHNKPVLLSFWWPT